jgi:hypothetical protein
MRKWHLCRIPRVLGRGPETPSFTSGFKPESVFQEISAAVGAMRPAVLAILMR